MHLNADSDADANVEMSMTRFSNRQQELLHNSFFQHDSKLNQAMKLFTAMAIKISGKTVILFKPKTTIHCEIFLSEYSRFYTESK